MNNNECRKEEIQDETEVKSDEERGIEEEDYISVSSNVKAGT